MYSGKFRLVAIPEVVDAYCACGHELAEVSNGLLGKVLFCTKCETVYELKLVKVVKTRITKSFLKQCREETRKSG